jgi:EF hand
MSVIGKRLRISGGLWGQRLSTVLVLCAGITMVGSPALAQMGPPNPDTDRDGRVTWPEYKLMAGRQTIEMLDKNKDGRVGKPEMQAILDTVKLLAGPSVVSRIMGRFDRDDQNKDGFLSLAEAEGAAKTRFDGADLNSDGWLSKAERKSMQRTSRAGSGG